MKLLIRSVYFWVVLGIFLSVVYIGMTDQTVGRMDLIGGTFFITTLFIGTIFKYTELKIGVQQCAKEETCSPFLPSVVIPWWFGTPWMVVSGVDTTGGERLFLVLIAFLASLMTYALVKSELKRWRQNGWI